MDRVRDQCQSGLFDEIHHYHTDISVSQQFLYFYFKEGESTSARQMVTSLIGQLIGSSSRITRGTLITHLQQYIDTHIIPFQGAGHVPDEKALWALLKVMIAVCEKQVVILLDALDECSEADASRIAEIIQHQDFGMVRFLLTGRPIIGPHFRKIPAIAVVAMDVRNDIEKFITEKLDNEKYESLRAHRDSIISTVCQSSDGMFRYAGMSPLGDIVVRHADLPRAKDWCWRSCYVSPINQ